jgi:hypothetical protein
MNTCYDHIRIHPTRGMSYNFLRASWISSFLRTICVLFSKLGVLLWTLFCKNASNIIQYMVPKDAGMLLFPTKISLPVVM